MRPFLTFLIVAALPAGAAAQGAAQAAEGGAGDVAEEAAMAATAGEAADVAEAEPQPADTGPEGLEIFEAADVDLNSFLWVKRPIIIFSDTPADPLVERQVRYILEREAEFVERDVVLILDTDPAARTQTRQRLRPRGFAVAILDKDGEVKQRRPSPRTGRELVAVIERFPLRRQEILEQRPSGRD
jgi:hypothetical protein